MRICMILEGSYPYVTGGVSSWVHQYMQAMPQHEFVILAIGADACQKGRFRYVLPENVTEIREVFLSDALRMGASSGKVRFSPAEKAALSDLMGCRTPCWETLFQMFSQNSVAPAAFLHSREFLCLLTELCRKDCPYAAFSDLFHTLRSMLLPVMYLLSQKPPKADLYHAVSTGYAGILGRLGSFTYCVPYLISEHGIYTREREEEILRADWVDPAFKRLWIGFFRMLSDGAYEKASKVTSLYQGAKGLQIDMGCDPKKCVCIGNGVSYERLCTIPQKQDNGYVDMGAVLRIAPIKDVKTMLYAFALMKRQVPKARLFIAGPEDDPEYARQCYALVRQLQVEDITFLGTVQVADWLGKFDVTLLSSISEGMPLSVLESFSAGVPVITTDVGCCRELVYAADPEDTFGAAGYCVPPMDAPAMAEAMVRMAQNPAQRRQMGRNGQNRVKKYFLHGDMIARYQKVYDEVMDTWQESAFL